VLGDETMTAGGTGRAWGTVGLLAACPYAPLTGTGTLAGTLGGTLGGG
jgi:hypothetical protein